MNPSLDRGYATCKAVTQHHAKTFYLASHLLDPQTRRAAYAVYAFCREIDDSIDEAPSREATVLAHAITTLRASLDRVYSFESLGSSSTQGRLLALRDTVRRYGIERSLFDDLITGVALDVHLKRVVSRNELDRYCYLVAGTVGIMMARIFGVVHDDALVHAVDLGKAMQITNILRDVREDLTARDRIYIPTEMLEEAGVTEASMRAGASSPALDSVVKTLIGQARTLYSSADRGVPMIVSRTGRAATRAMRAGYSSILDVIEAGDLNVLAGRAVVPGWKRAWVSLQGAMDLHREKATS